MAKAIPELDGIRAVAILPVLALHGSEFRFFGGGYLGVDLFFVLSGFLITGLLAQEHAETGRVDLAHFYARRALRILPALFLAIALGLLLWRGGDASRAIPAIVLFYANFLDWRDLGVMSHTWSLSIEEQFYLAWPALLLLAARRGARHVMVLAAALVAAALLIRIALLAAGADRESLYRFTFTRMDALAAGCFAAMWLRSRGDAPPPMAAAVPLGLLLIACAAFVLGPAHDGVPMLVFGYTGFAALFAALIVSMLCSEPGNAVRTLLALPVMRYIGRRSYGLYLFHLPVFAACDTLREPGIANFLAVSVLRFGATFAIAELSYRTIEVRALALKSRFPGGARRAAISDPG